MICLYGQLYYQGFTPEDFFFFLDKTNKMCTCVVYDRWLVRYTPKAIELMCSRAATFCILALRYLAQPFANDRS